MLHVLDLDLLDLKLIGIDKVDFLPGRGRRARDRRRSGRGGGGRVLICQLVRIDEPRVLFQGVHPTQLGQILTVVVHPSGILVGRNL